jgi:hypothetical protein
VAVSIKTLQKAQGDRVYTSAIDSAPQNDRVSVLHLLVVRAGLIVKEAYLRGSTKVDAAFATGESKVGQFYKFGVVTALVQYCLDHAVGIAQVTHSPGAESNNFHTRPP